MGSDYHMMRGDPYYYKNYQTYDPPHRDKLAQMAVDILKKMDLDEFKPIGEGDMNDDSWDDPEDAPEDASQDFIDAISVTSKATATDTFERNLQPFVDRLYERIEATIYHDWVPGGTVYVEYSGSEFREAAKILREKYVTAGWNYSDIEVGAGQRKITIR